MRRPRSGPLVRRPQLPRFPDARVLLSECGLRGGSSQSVAVWGSLQHKCTVGIAALRSGVRCDTTLGFRHFESLQRDKCFSVRGSGNLTRLASFSCFLTQAFIIRVYDTSVRQAIILSVRGRASRYVRSLHDTVRRLGYLGLGLQGVRVVGKPGDRCHFERKIRWLTTRQRFVAWCRAPMQSCFEMCRA